MFEAVGGALGQARISTRQNSRAVPGMRLCVEYCLKPAEILERTLAASNVVT
jgi:hypothetical protein